jgi:FkbH-like protein
MRYEADTLDYLALLKEARSPAAAECAKTIKLALLADFATQHLTPILKVLFARNGVKLDVYEAGYDSIDTEILDPGSGLHAFAPRYVVILVATEKLKARLYPIENRGNFAEAAAARFTTLWEALKRSGSATVIQGNYVTPSERAFGNFELKAVDSVGSIVADINHRLAAAAREANNVLLCDIDHIAADVGRRNWFDEPLWAMAKGLCRLEYLPLLAQALVDIALAGEGAVAKCVVLDLDNTLWGGVIGDDGLAGIALGDFDEGEAFVGFQRFLRELKRRGIILAVVSKNEEANALLPFREHPNMVLREEDISVFIANWDNKADNIRRVQKVLNIGFDSLVFLDDNPFERGLVKEFLPDVVVPDLPEDPSLYVRTLAKLNLFETAAYSAADRQRPGQYRQEAQRELAREVYTNIDDYLRSLDMTIKLERFTPFNLPRIAQLIQRSNQFNLTTRRLNEAACEALMNDKANWLPFTVTLRDKFGDYGLISVVILKLLEHEVEIDTYLMSCRVLRRGVEQFVMNTIFAEAGRRRATRVVGRYLRSAKNDMVKNFYAGFDFEQIETRDNGDTSWTLSPVAYKPTAAFMTQIGEGL